MQLIISVSHHPPVTVLRLAGDLDLATTGLLAGTLDDLLRDGHTTLVVDASALDFCDVTGVDALLEGHMAADRAGGSLRLSGVHGFLHRVLELTRLCDVLQTTDLLPERADGFPPEGFRPDGADGFMPVYH
ncbi:STAS domain-containing protein [Sphaerisporangium sp. NPDC049002]|uniref:STAS domain-containing protein n=1 Tax=unclassified Sphaerisporangium TaxID=2630420 RepID=UPI0033E2E255